VTEIVPLKKFTRARIITSNTSTQEFQRALLPGCYRAKAGKAGEEKGDSGNAADEEVNCSLCRRLFIPEPRNGNDGCLKARHHCRAAQSGA